MTNGLFVGSFAEGQVTGRGCSTKDKVFYKECETHSYGEQVEKMCFCSYFLCNLSSVLAPPSCLLLMIIGATLCVLNSDGLIIPTISYTLPSSDAARNPRYIVRSIPSYKSRISSWGFFSNFFFNFSF